MLIWVIIMVFLLLSPVLQDSNKHTHIKIFICLNSNIINTIAFMTGESLKGT